MRTDQIIFKLRKLNALFQDYFIDQDEYTDRVIDLVEKLGSKPYEEESKCTTAE